MSQKVVTLNLEQGRPTVETALVKLKNSLSTYRQQGVKAVIAIHGYGSSGTGGNIKPAIKQALNSPSLSGIVRKHTGGEDWYLVKREFTSICNQLEGYENRIYGNSGVTVILLK